MAGDGSCEVLTGWKFPAKKTKQEDRFASSTSPLDLPQLINSANLHNTKEKANWAYRVFQSWVSWYKENAPADSNSGEILSILQNKSLLTMTQQELSSILSVFIQQARNKNGQRYPGKTLYELTSLQKYLEINQRTISLINKDSMPIFTLYYGLDVAMKQSTSEGIGMHTKQVDPITHDQEEKLWSEKILDMNTPHGLQRALFYVLGVNFALRVGQAHRDLTIQNFSVQQDSRGQEYLLYTETRVVRSQP